MDEPIGYRICFCGGTDERRATILPFRHLFTIGEVRLIRPLLLQNKGEYDLAIVRDVGAPMPEPENRIGMLRAHIAEHVAQACAGDLIAVVFFPRRGRVCIFDDLARIEEGDDIYAVAVLFSNEPFSGSWKDAVVPIDRIEKLAGIDLFSSLPGIVESSLESVSGALPAV